MPNLRPTGLQHPYSFYERVYGIRSQTLLKYNQKGYPLDDPVELFRKITTAPGGHKPPLQTLINFLNDQNHRVNGAPVTAKPDQHRPSLDQGASTPNVDDPDPNQGTITISFPRITFTRSITLDEVSDVMGAASWETLQT